MSLEPINLQATFLRQSLTGKELTEQKEAAQLLQAQQASHLAKRAELEAYGVSESKDLGDGIEKSGSEKRKGSGRHKPHEPTDEEADENEDLEVIRDPELGKHFDITG